MKIDYLKFPSGKKYVFLRDGENRIFLRNILFVHKPNNKRKVVIVREWGSPTDRAAWEPPKGQMEWKELEEEGVRKGQDLSAQMMEKYMREGVLRELGEEAKIMPEEILGLQMMQMSYTEEFPEAGKNSFFRYQFWEASLSDLRPAQKRINQLVRNEDWVQIVTPDVKEKDAVCWWEPQTATDWGKIRKAFSFAMTRMYYDVLPNSNKK
jgi:hypothetical protein